MMKVLASLVVLVVAFGVCAEAIQCGICYEFGMTDCTPRQGVSETCTGRCYKAVGKVRNGTGFVADSTARGCMSCKNLNSSMGPCLFVNATLTAAAAQLGGVFAVVNCTGVQFDYSGNDCPTTKPPSTAEPSTAASKPVTGGAGVVFSASNLAITAAACAFGAILRQLKH